MNKKLKIALITVAVVILVAVGIVLYFHYVKPVITITGVISVIIGIIIGLIIKYLWDKYINIDEDDIY